MNTNDSYIFYLMGASGSGKDSLLRLCRDQFTAADRCFVAHRYITREPELTGENHVWLTEQEFSQRQALNAFAMHWQANGHRYGIGREVDAWLDLGVSVLVNGSRGFLPQAQALYPQRLVPLVVQVDSVCLERRLRQRGRETDPQIVERVERALQFQQCLGADIMRIDNNGLLEQGVSQLLRVLRTFDRVGAAQV